jgi:excisionase family DNA binding protein
VGLPERASQPAVIPRSGRSLSLDRAAEFLGVSRRTIYNYIRDGRLQTMRTLGGSQRVLLDSIEEEARVDPHPAAPVSRETTEL